ncbi:hypothetical protein BJ742DRAFT_218688 [Cladochytrium replicatum]|nr:hypothetical protein BJ742DRAFT_218688 [Cladochytrium replicatum]
MSQACPCRELLLSFSPLTILSVWCCSVISRTRARLERFFSTASTYYDIQSDDTAGAKRSLRIPSEGPTAINGKSLVAEYLEGLHTSADFRRLQMSNGGQ